MSKPQNPNLKTDSSAGRQPAPKENVLPAEAGTNLQPIETLIFGSLESSAGMGCKEIGLRIADLLKTLPEFADVPANELQAEAQFYLEHHPDESNRERAAGIASLSRFFNRRRKA